MSDKHKGSGEAADGAQLGSFVPLSEKESQYEELISSLAHRYVALVRVDLDDDTGEVFQIGKQLGELFGLSAGDVRPYAAQVAAYIDANVSKENAAVLANLLDSQQIRATLAVGESQAYAYRTSGKTDSSWLRIVLSRSERKGEYFVFTLAFEDISEEMSAYERVAREMENGEDAEL